MKDKLALKKAIKPKSVKVKFALLENKREEKEEEEEIDKTESTPDIPMDYLSAEIKEILEKIDEKKKYLSTEGQKEVDRQCQSLIQTYQENLNNSKPNLNNILNNTLEFGHPTPDSLKNKLISDLTKILSNFYHDDLENLIKKIRSYQELLKDLPDMMEEDDLTKKQIWDMGLIIKNYQCEELENNLNLLLEDTIKKAHKIMEGDLDDKIELTLDPNANISTTFKIEIELLYNKAIEYQHKNEPIKELLEDLDMQNERKFSQELKEYKERIERLNDTKVNTLFKETLDKYKEYLKNKLHSLEVNNIDIKVIQDMIRYALSTINLYLITKEKTIIKKEDLKSYLEEAIKELEENQENNNIFVDMVKGIKNKSHNLSHEEQIVIKERVKEVLNKWLKLLENENSLAIDNLMKKYQEEQIYGNIKVPGIMFKSKEIFVYYLIIKDLKDIEINIDIYSKRNAEHEKAIRNI